MGFSLFGKKKDHHKFADRAFMTEAGKMNACLEMANEEPSTVFIAWFPATARSFRAFFQEKGIGPERVKEANHFHPSTDRHIVFVEHYPLHQKELDLVQTATQEQFIVFSSLDEPLFKHFGSEKMLPVMKMLGMKEDTVIEHQMVTKSIVRAQEKIASKINFEQSANSQQDWMLKNIGGSL